MHILMVSAEMAPLQFRFTITQSGTFDPGHY